MIVESIWFRNGNNNNSIKSYLTILIKCILDNIYYFQLVTIFH